MELAALAVLVASLLLTLDAGKIIMMMIIMMMMMMMMIRRLVTARGTDCIRTLPVRFDFRLFFLLKGRLVHPSE